MKWLPFLLAPLILLCASSLAQQDQSQPNNASQAATTVHADRSYGKGAADLALLAGSCRDVARYVSLRASRILVDS